MIAAQWLRLTTKGKMGLVTIRDSEVIAAIRII